MKRLSLFILCLLCITTVAALEVPTMKRPVVDLAEMLTEEEEQEITALIISIEKETTAEIAVLTVSSLEGIAKEAYAAEVFEKNKFGKEDKDNGLLLLISSDDRVYRVEVGYGLEGFVTDAKKVDIGVKIIEANFKAGEFGRGVHDAVAAVGGLIVGEEEVLSKYGSSSITPVMRSPLSGYGMLFFFLLMIILSAISRKKTGRGLFFLPIIIGPGFGGGFSGNSGGFGNSGFGGFGGGSFGGGGFGGSW